MKKLRRTVQRDSWRNSNSAACKREQKVEEVATSRCSNYEFAKRTGFKIKLLNLFICKTSFEVHVIELRILKLDVRRLISSMNVLNRTSLFSIVRKIFMSMSGLYRMDCIYSICKFKFVKFKVKLTR